MLQEAHMWNNNQWSEKIKGCHGLVLPSGQNGACGKENTGELFIYLFILTMVIYNKSIE